VAPLIGLWLICAVAGVFVGQARGRHPVEGALFGGLLGPIGLLILALGEDRRQKCWECGGPMEDGARRCRHCGYDRSEKGRGAPRAPRPGGK
jgi:hypothetical protein